ncbi:hypothetical protein OCU04_011762 [Sclerotinia nivalis]|uniref:Clr5 domain-containing protein n=1 Tax=Sclerotinia nivalis TaxID=352851 RepID=A0A9X0DFD9_9HELO|nr:hypothetical protein OCU04_011762 [Sclerotinia nivalis]
MNAQLLPGNKMSIEVEEKSLSTEGLKVLSSEEWLKFKPIIQRLYIDENKTFKVVASKLLSEVGFCPTKRQFTRKIEEWGLKKNFRKTERKFLLQNRNLNGTMHFGLGDKRILDPRRTQRLKRRYRHESQRPQDLPREEIDAISIPAAPSCSSPEEQQPTINHMEEIPSSHSMPLRLEIPDENTAMDIEHWPFDWDAVDVPGSPGLTRLFELLELEASITPMDLDDEVVEEKQLVSGTELRDKIERDGTTNRQISSAYSHVKYGTMLKAAVRPVPTTRKRLPWSPLFELDIFPTSRSAPGHRMMLASVSTRSIETWNIEVEDWKLKLSKLTKTLSGHNPAIILCLEHLVILYGNLGLDSLRLYRQILDARLKEVNRNGYAIIETYLDIVKALLQAGRYSDAAYLHRSLHQTIQQSRLGVEHPLYIRSSYLEAYILCQSNQEAEHTIRLVVQKALTFLGPSHTITINAFSLLGNILGRCRTKSCSEVEKLYGYSIQANRSYFQNESFAYFKNIFHLIDVLEDKKQFEESYNLCTYIMGHLEPTVGKRQHRYYHFRRKLGCILCGWGRLPESIKLFHEMLADMDFNLSSSYRSPIYRHLARALRKSGNFREAIVWYKRSLLDRVKIYGWSNSQKIKTLSVGLGDCYKKLLRFGDALLFYEKLLEKLKIALTADHPFIKRVERWIVWERCGWWWGWRWG